MNRIAVFSQSPKELEGWRPWLEQNYEVTYISSDQALKAILDTWHPNLLIYHEKNIRSEFIKTLEHRTRMHSFGLMVVSPVYNLREELLAFEVGADHFLLASSPIEGVRARINSLFQKITQKHSAVDRTDLVSLPQKNAPIRFKSLTIYPDQNCVQSGEHTVRITPTQIRLLCALVQNTGALLSREWMQKNVFDDAPISPRSIDAHIAKLKKLVPALKTEIVCIYGKGYVFKSDGQKVA